MGLDKDKSANNDALNLDSYSPLDMIATVKNEPKILKQMSF